MTPRPARPATRTDTAPNPAPLLKALLLSSAVVLTGAQIARGQDTTETHAFSNFGEVKYGPDIEHLDYVNPDAPKGGEISISAMGTFDSFNNYSRKGVSAALATIGSESIVISTADDPYGLYCFICTTMEYPEDLKWVTFNLRDDVTFADGEPMVAEDVEFSFNLFLEQGITEYRRIVEGFIEDVDVIDDHTIKFTFTDEAPIRERIGFAGGTPVFSKDWFEETGARLDDSSEEPFMSTGAYVLESKDFNRQIVYSRNPDYWAAEHPLQVGRNNFDRIRVEYFADSQAAFEAFKAGAFTFRVENSSLIWATGYDFPNLNDGYVVKEEIPDGTVGTAQSFIFNLDRETWQDKRVRDAIAMMFNFEWSNQALFYGLYDRVDSFWPGTDLAARGTPSEAELEILEPLVDEGLLDAAILTEEAPVPPVNEADQNRPARGTFRAAGRLLEDAGWIPGDDGVRRNEAGDILTLEILSYDPNFDRIINPYIENLEQLGVNAELERVDTAQYVENRRAGDFDMTSHGFSMGFEPGIGLEQWFHSKTADDSSRNLMRLRNEAVDRIIPSIVGAETLETLESSVHALDRTLRSIGFMVPQWFKPVHTVAYFDMYGKPETIPPLDMGYLDFWWYDADKHQALIDAGVLR
ncbi:extracellular solute-binding protein [Maritimibacter sp. UBA3975]|uniref:extracellular solute-binding protein n=1 Tax=Maritimibacter sp. UBA3975 TaxID=1946833 RepID=UPI000C09F271|nr:extracellular solute-binding protein [Maritimibacter sp. UBA3975]MAM62156.1 ABC transporter substrate-binding protein [Maritimibacter sp.]|tara:strand:+ start:17354 stop:19267 length:1914 start_codon:yes stop_codon:yes gene_type:complete